ncbi:Hypothetical predicted protein [Mytilus galloprovincialis]|uniref:Uncharacterized protein n=1 Tax=Mytilus galloprovincialis TaxID=29158 RepID=A0A8B6GP21_MYTGA|nr:Hypothetical predicted protein [Mytilus galloprovincialis]
MDISRLKSLRAGNKAAVTKVFKKLEEAIGDSQIDTEEVSTLLEAIEKKKKTLASIDEQILNAVESEDITNEILETDEYYLDLEGVKRVTTDKTRPINTTDKSLNSNRKKQCTYCDGNHWPNECKDVIDHDKRVAIIKEKRENAPELPTNEDIAKRRTESVIRRLKKDPEMFRKYGEIITDQEQRGFIEKLQQILKKHFLHIELDVDDRDVTRFYWLENPMDTESRLITYRFKVVLFGATCSPFMLSATLMKHFRDNPSTTSRELTENAEWNYCPTDDNPADYLLEFTLNNL